MSNAIHYTERYSRQIELSAVIRVYADAGNVTETHERKGDFKNW